MDRKRAEKEKKTKMDRKRAEVLLFNAVDLLLGFMDREEICEETGMSEEEFEGLLEE